MSIGRSLAKSRDITVGDRVDIVVAVTTAPGVTVISSVCGQVIEQRPRAIKLSNGHQRVWLPRGALCKGTRDTATGHYHFQMAKWFEPTSDNARTLDRMTTHNMVTQQDTSP